MNLAEENLTIAIPTFNRANELQQLLISIDKIFGCITVVISDNGSSDNTEEIVEFFKNHSNLKINYIKSIFNKGPDYNYFKAIEAVDTKYCILFGSDDKFEFNALVELEKAISENIDIVIYRRKLYNIDFTLYKSEESFYNKDSKTYFLSNDLSYINYFNNCKSLGALFSYISSILFKKEIWLDSVKTRSFFGTAYSHSAALFEGMRARTEITLLAANVAIVSCRLGNDSFSSLGILERYKIDWDGYEKIANLYFPDCKLQLHKILAKQMSFRQCLALAHNLKKNNLFNEIKYVDVRLRNCKWGRDIFIKWSIAKIFPTKLTSFALFVMKK